MQNNKTVLVKQNEEIQHQNTAYQQHLVTASHTVQNTSPKRTIEHVGVDMGSGHFHTNK